MSTPPRSINTTRVLIADDQPMMREVLARYLARTPELELVARAADAEEAIRLAAATQPDVAVVDVKMPAGGGASAVRGILACSPGTRILVLSSYSDRAVVLEMLRAGAISYLVKGASSEDILDAIMRTARGSSVLSAEIAEGVLGELANQLNTARQAVDDRRALASRVRAVIESRLLQPVFQPIVDLSDGSTVGFEALSRFFSRPIQSPDRWFDDAERVGMRDALEVTAAAAALSHIGRLPDDAYLSINLSPDTLPRCAELIDGLPSERIVIELTEHAAIEDYRAARAALAPLRAVGVRVAVDDAGAGFASLRHALQLAPDFIKLDVSLCRGIDADRQRRALAAGLVGFAQELPAAIVAEGIETPAELQALRDLGVRYAQGFYLAMPGPLPGPHPVLQRDA